MIFVTPAIRYYKTDFRLIGRLFSTINKKKRVISFLSMILKSHVTPDLLVLSFCNDEHLIRPRYRHVITVSSNSTILFGPSIFYVLTIIHSAISLKFVFN